MMARFSGDQLPGTSSRITARPSRSDPPVAPRSARPLNPNTELYLASKVEIPVTTNSVIIHHHAGAPSQRKSQL